MMRDILAFHPVFQLNPLLCIVVVIFVELGKLLSNLYPWSPVFGLYSEFACCSLC